MRGWECGQKRSGKFPANTSPVVGSMLREQKNKLRVSLMELNETCPFDNCNPKDCPLFPFRKMSRWRRFRWFRALPESDLVYLAVYHYACFATKVTPRLSVISSAGLALGGKKAFCSLLRNQNDKEQHSV